MPPLTDSRDVAILETAVKSGELEKLDKAIISWSRDRELKDLLTDLLVISCANLCRQVALHLLDRPDIDPNLSSELVKGYERVPPLMVAVRALSGQSFSENLSIAERLIDKGAKLDTVDDHGWTCLHHAAAHGNTTLARALLEKGAMTSPGRDSTPLHLACANGAQAVVELLLSKHACAEATTEEDVTPLHIAAAQGYCSIVELLLPHMLSSDVNAVCIGGWTPLHLACAGSQTALINSLARAGQWNLFTEHARTATTVDRCRVVELLLAKGAMVFRKSNSLKTALHLAAVSGDTGIICLLLGQKRLHIAAKDHLGNTPLLDAVEARQSREVIDSLVPWSHRAIKCLPKRVKKVIEHSYASIIDFSPPQFDLHKSQQTIFDLLYVSQGQNGDETRRRPVTKPASDEKGSFRWIHLPANNMSWCETLITRWFVEGDCLESERYVALVRSLSQKQYQGPKVHSIHMRPTFGQVYEADMTTFYLYMPYLELELTRISTVDTNTPLSEAYDSWSENEHFHHRRRTLDQFWYKSLDTKKRDCTQVMSHYLLGQSIEGLLMVDQLWIWALGPELIITSFPHIEQHRLIEKSDLFASILERINPRTEGSVRNAGALIDIIIEQCISACDRSIRRMCNVDYFDVFNFSATAVMEAQIELFDEFQEISIAASEWIKRSLQQSTTNQMKPLPFVERLLTLGREISLLAQARDIEDELGILGHILDDQISVLRSKRQGLEVRSYHPKFEELLQRVKRDIPQTTEWMQGVCASITDLLEHKQRYVNTIDANFAREQAKSAEVGNRTLLVFTIVTIVFAPMSFLAAFFAIDIEAVPKNFKQERASGLDIVYWYVVGLGLGTSGFIIVVALCYQWVWAKIVEFWENHIRRTDSSKTDGVRSAEVEQGGRSASRNSAKSGSSSSISCLPLPHRRQTARRDVETGEKLGG
jgi:ankyrin repeat protein